jgi:hypothetical protein
MNDVLCTTGGIRLMEEDENISRKKTIQSPLCPQHVMAWDRTWASWMISQQLISVPQYSY